MRERIEVDLLGADNLDYESLDLHTHRHLEESFNALDSVLGSGDELVDVVTTAVHEGLTPEQAVDFLLDDLVLARCNPFELGSDGVATVLRAVDKVTPLLDRQWEAVHTRVLSKLSGVELPDDAIAFIPPADLNDEPGGYLTSRTGLVRSGEVKPDLKAPNGYRGDEIELWRQHASVTVLDGMLKGPPMHPGLLGWVWFHNQHTRSPHERAIRRLAEQWEEQQTTLNSFQPDELRVWLRHLLRWSDRLTYESNHPMRPTVDPATMDTMMCQIADAYCAAELAAGHPNPFDYDAAPERAITPIGWYDSHDGLRITPNGREGKIETGASLERPLFSAAVCVWPPELVASRQIDTKDVRWDNPYTSIGKWLSMRHPPDAMLDVGAWHPEHAEQVLHHPNARPEHRAVAQMMTKLDVEQLREGVLHPTPVRCNRLIVTGSNQYEGFDPPEKHGFGVSPRDHPSNLEPTSKRHPQSGQIARCGNTARRTFYGGWCGRCKEWLTEFHNDVSGHGNPSVDGNKTYNTRILSSQRRHQKPHLPGSKSDNPEFWAESRMGPLETFELAAIRRWMSVDDLAAMTGTDPPSASSTDGEAPSVAPAATVPVSLRDLQRSVSRLRHTLLDGFTESTDTEHRPAKLNHRLAHAVSQSQDGASSPSGVQLDRQANSALANVASWMDGDNMKGLRNRPAGRGLVPTPPGCVVNGSSVTYYPLPADDLPRFSHLSHISTGAGGAMVCATDFSAGNDDMRTAFQTHDTALLLTDRHLSGLDADDATINVRSLPTGTRSSHPAITVTDGIEPGGGHSEKNAGQATIIPKRAPIHPNRFTEHNLLDPTTGHVTVPAHTPTKGGAMVLHVPTVWQSLREHQRATAPSFEQDKQSRQQHNYSVDQPHLKPHAPVVVFQPADTDGDSPRLTFSTAEAVENDAERLQTVQRAEQDDSGTIDGVLAAVSGRGGYGARQEPRPVLLPAEYLKSACEHASRNGSDTLNLAWVDGTTTAGTRTPDEPLNMPLVHFDCDPHSEKSTFGVTVAATTLPGPTTIDPLELETLIAS